MSTVILCTKIYNNSQLKFVDSFLKSKFKELQIVTKVSGIVSRKWVQVTVSGEDEKIALHLLADEVGLCPINLEDIKRFSTFKGFIAKVDEDEIGLDIGIFSPKNVNVTITLQNLQAQLMDGRKVAPKKISEFFGFCENLPLTVKILSVNNEKNRFDVVLSENQLAIYRNWAKSLLDKLIILGAPIQAINLVLKKTGLNRDVLNVEPLGLFEFAVTCKLGTDAKGLIPKIGKTLRNATFSVFSPRKALEFLDYSSPLIS